MPTMRYEFEIERYWTQSDDWTGLAWEVPFLDQATTQLRSAQANLRNAATYNSPPFGPHTQRSKSGQKRTYTNGVLTATQSFTLPPGDSLQVGPLTVDTRTSYFGSRGVFVEEADPANWHHAPLPHGVTGTGVNLVFSVEGTV